MNLIKLLNEIRTATNAQLIAFQDELQELKRYKKNSKKDLALVKRALNRILDERERRAMA